MSGALRKLLKLPITLPLRIPAIRRMVAYEMRPHFEDMRVEVPLSAEIYCPLGHWDSVYSFSEIFVANEYGSFLDIMPLPRRWLDLGCHAGYFTLFMAWKIAAAGRPRDWNALLIDADPRMVPYVTWTLQRNHLENNARFVSAMISAEKGVKEFAMRHGMGSSSGDVTEADEICRVPCIDAAEIGKALPPPYDLIKIDIEGAEYDFVRNYPDLCRRAAYIMAEWHSNDEHGARRQELRGLCEAAGFEHAAELREIRPICVDGVWSSSGIDLYRRRTA